MQNVIPRRAVIGLDVLIDDPTILKPDTDSPKLAEELYVPLGYNSTIIKYLKERSNRGDACRDLAHYLPELLRISEKSDAYYHDVRLGNGTLVHFAEIEGCPKATSSHDQSIALAKNLMASHQGDCKIFASHNTLTLMAASNFIPYEIIPPQVYTGRRKVTLPADCATEWYSKRGIPDDVWTTYISEKPLLPNEYVEFQPEYSDITEGGHLHVENIGHYSFDRKTGKGRIIPLAFTHPEHKAYHKIYPKTAAQAMMFDALLAPSEEIPLVIIPGPAGSGKTFCSVAAGLSQIEQGLYDRFFVVSSETKIGEKHGFLPGDLMNKILPLGASVINALRAVLDVRDYDGKPGYKNKADYDDNNINYSDNPLGITAYEQSYLDKYFQFMAMRFVKGMSIPNAILYFDESQDFSRDQISELITRCGESSKVVLTGDPNQSDFADKKGDFSGLDFITRRLIGADYAAVIRPTREESRRSVLTSRILTDIERY